MTNPDQAVTTCPTCKRRPSMRLGHYTEEHDGGSTEVESDECPDPIHDLADRLVADAPTGFAPLRCHVCNCSLDDQVGIEVPLCADHIPEHHADLGAVETPHLQECIRTYMMFEADSSVPKAANAELAALKESREFWKTAWHNLDQDRSASPSAERIPDPSYETIAEMLPSVLASGTEKCPLCGAMGVHDHTPAEIIIYRNGVKYGRSLTGSVPPSAERILTQATDVERLRVCIPSTETPGDRFVCEAHGRWSAETLSQIDEELNNAEFDCSELAPLDGEGCAWVTARYQPQQVGEFGRVEIEGCWEIDRLQHFPARSGATVVEWPAEITPALQEVLGLPMFKTAPVAHIFRAAGHNIPPKVEAEQAFVLFWAIGLALKHGEKWHERSLAEIDSLRRLTPAPSTASASESEEK